jgi:RimJ/RimL family protein N-acetyltransferase
MALPGASARPHARPVKTAPTLDIRVRRIVPEDADELCRFYAALSPDSRRLRFLSLGTRFGDTDAQYFCGSDHEHREGFVAELVNPEPDGTRIIGHLCLEPTRPDEMEIAVAIADAYQRRGIGRRLVAAAAAWASAHGVARFRAWFAPDNIGIKRLLEYLDRPIRFGPWSAGTVDISIDLQGVATEPRAA